MLKVNRKPEEGAVTTAADLREKVLREINWDRQIPRHQVSVQVDDGVVVLQGTVEHGAQRTAAQEAAHRAAGDHNVVNNIVVRYPIGLAHADARLTDDLHVEPRTEVLALVG